MNVYKPIFRLLFQPVEYGVFYQGLQQHFHHRPVQDGWLYVQANGYFSQKAVFYDFCVFPDVCRLVCNGYNALPFDGIAEEEG